MAISSDKLLNRPSELHRRYGGRLAMQKAHQEKMVGGGPVSIVFTKKSIKNIELIKDNVVKIEGILKGTIAAEKKALDEKKKKESSQRREKQEEKLEAKPDMSMGSIKMPRAPRMGILDWIKNFIGKIILGYFAYRLVEHLPKIIPIVKFIGNATDFIIDVGGKLLNGLATFIDWGYKAYDATRGFIKNIGGENFAQGFDKFVGAIDTALFLTTVLAGDLVAEAMFGGGGGGDPGEVGIKGARDVAGRSRYGTSSAAARRYAERFGRDAAVRKFGEEGVRSLGGKYARSGITNLARKGFVGVLGKGGAKAVLGTVRPLLKRIPIPVVGALIDFGLSWALGEDPGRAAFRAIGAGLLGSIGTALGGGIGLAGGPLALVGATIGGLAGGTLGDMAGGAIYDMFFGGKKSQSKDKVQKKAGGGITRGGKTQGGVKRTIKKGKYKRVLAPKKPSETKFETEDKNVKEVSKDLDKTKYFGPVLSVSAKILENQKPTQKDYENVGLGLNLLISKGIEEKQLKGGLVAAFAEGGMVDDDFLEASEKGGDISNWVTETFKNLFETKVERNLRMIKESQIQKSTSLEGKDQFDEDGTILEGTTGGEYGPILDLIASVEAVGGYDVVNGGKISGLSKMTISAARQAAMRSGGSGAMGRYQQMPQYVLDRARSIGLNPDRDLFSPENQDKLAIILIDGAGYKKWKIGQMSTEKFAHNLSATWRGLPEGPNNLTYQDRYASGNKAHTTWANVMATLNAVKSGKITGGDRGNFPAEILGKSGSFGLKDPTPRSSPGVRGSSGYASDSGLDIVGKTGDPIVSPVNGTLLYAETGHTSWKDDSNPNKDGYQSQHSFLIQLSKPFKYAGKTIKYAYGTHLSSLSGAVANRSGIEIKAGQTIGAMGVANKVPHLHLGLLQNRAQSSESDWLSNTQVKNVLTGASAFQGENFGVVPKDGFMLRLHKGEVFKVIDRDSVDLLGFDLTKEIIDIENRSQLIAKAPSIIEKLKAISGYTDYEQPYAEPEIIEVPVPMPFSDGGDYSSGGFSMAMGGGGEEDSSFDSLYVGG